MWLALVLCLAALAFGVVWFGLVPPPHANTLLRFRAGMIRITRGSVRPHAKEGVTEILSEAKLSRGFIAIMPGNRVMFSRNIPTAIHQRLRNVLLNQ